jgi:hypothetical protein
MCEGRCRTCSLERLALKLLVHLALKLLVYEALSYMCEGRCRTCSLERLAHTARTFKAAGTSILVP